MTQLPNNFFAVQVPEGAKGFTVIESHSYFPSPRVEHSIGGINLPPGNWQIVSLASEITEEQAGEIAEHHLYPDA